MRGSPPVGARVWTGLSATPLVVAEAYRFLADPAAGGLCVFVGTTRQWTGDAETSALDYDAYEAMAGTELTRLAVSAAARWPLVSIVLLHRTGRVGIAEPSVIAGAAAPHRAAAFEAAQWLIDTLKADVPIWKRDLAPDGTTAWTEPSTR